MGRIYINRSFLRSEINRQLKDDKQLARLAYDRVQQEFNDVKEVMLDEFENHPVTQELKAGAKGENVSGSVLPTGNLFSFIGFEVGQDPTDPIRDILQAATVIYNPRPKYAGKMKIRFQFSAVIPSFSVIENATPMPEWTSGSWVRRIERSISGITHYLYYEDKKKAKEFNSRSKTGIQIKGSLNKSFNRVNYISQIIKNFNNRLIGIK